MKTYHGSCHCGVVRFEVDLDLAVVSECNCSICSKKGQLSARAPAERFRLISGEDYLQIYQFHTQRALHYFCRRCGIHPYHRSRASPSSFTINVLCLDDYDLETERPEVRKFDGRHWEEAVKMAKFD